MIKSVYTYSVLILLGFWVNHSKSQSFLIINEISNGPSGSQEYIELAVVSNSVTQICNGGPLPKIDIRGWIFDDNNGYHGPSGIASGALRFAYNPLWANVPLGTIILIYNDADKNPNIPPDDLSLTDGNCKLIIPVSSNLFDKNTTTPGSVSCSYPTTPSWVSGGTWSFNALANAGDCIRVVNLLGCEVFSVCYGTDNLNNMIYFSGNGGQTVYYFNGSDPTNQSNWSSGVASVTGSAETPGVVNNVLNSNYINQFSSNCSTIKNLNLSTINQATLGCATSTLPLSATSSSTNNITFTWIGSGILDGANTATAVVNQPGNYTVTVQDGSCINYSVVAVVNEGGVPSLSVNQVTLSCNSNTISLIATSSSANTLSYNWTGSGGIVSGANTPTVTVNQIGNYTVTVQDGSCINYSVVAVVPNDNALTLIVSANTVIAMGSQVSLLATSSSNTYTWSPDNSLSCLNCANPIASPIITTQYCVNASIGNCFKNACVTVSVEELCSTNSNYQVPNAFSPNGDGVNDFFCLNGWSGCVKEFSLLIYNRWGEKIVESHDENFCWDGYFKGQLLGSAVYVCVISAEIENIGRISRKTNITLLR